MYSKTINMLLNQICLEIFMGINYLGITTTTHQCITIIFIRFFLQIEVRFLAYFTVYATLKTVF